MKFSLPGYSLGAGITMLMLFSLNATYAETVPVNFQGTLVEPPSCTISSDQQIDIDFGAQVGVSKVDGVNYIQPVNYQLSCPPGGPGLSLSMMVSGAATAFDTSALQTNITDLGIKLLQNGSDLQLNTRFPVDVNTPPVLQAVPVKAPGSTLPEGDFSVIATLLVGYQ